MNLQNFKKMSVPILKKAGVTRAALFGSVARGEETAESDIDVLVEMPSGATLFDLVGLEQALEHVFNRSVDVVTYKALHSRLKPYIEPDAIALL